LSYVYAEIGVICAPFWLIAFCLQGFESRRARPHPRSSPSVKKGHSPRR